MLADHREFLRFGDSIYLHASAEIDLIRRAEVVDGYPVSYYQGAAGQQGQPHQIGTLCGFLSAKGFMCSEIFFQKTNVPLSLNEVEMPNLLNSRDFRFVLVPALKCEFHQEYERAVEELKKVQLLMRNLDEGELVHHMDSLKKFEDRVQKAQERAKMEVLHNRQLVKEHLGDEIYYGMDVQLMHCDSEMFLNAKEESSETDRIGYKLELSRHFQLRMLFQLLPRFKSRLVGEKIQYGDQVHLLNVVSKQNLCISDTQFEPPFDLSEGDEHPLLAQQNVVDTSCSRHVAYLGDGEYNIWKILVHSKWDTALKMGGKLHGHNFVRFYLADADAYLGSSVSFEGGAPEVYLRNYSGENIEEKTGVNSIWELTHFCKIYQGAEFQTDKNDRVLIRHFNSGKILAIGKNNVPHLQDYGEYLRREREQLNPGLNGSPSRRPGNLLTMQGIIEQADSGEPYGIDLGEVRKSTNALLPVSVGASPEVSSDSDQSSKEGNKKKRKSQYSGMAMAKIPQGVNPNLEGSHEEDSFEEKVMEEKDLLAPVIPETRITPNQGYKVALNLKSKQSSLVPSSSDPSLRGGIEGRTGNSKIAANLGSGFRVNPSTVEENSPVSPDELVAGTSKADKPNKEKLDQIFKRQQVRSNPSRDPQPSGDKSLLTSKQPDVNMGEGTSVQHDVGKRTSSPPLIRRKIGATDQAIRNAQDQAPQASPEMRTLDDPDILHLPAEGSNVGRDIGEHYATQVKTQHHSRRQAGNLIDQDQPAAEPQNRLKANLSRVLRREDSQNGSDTASPQQRRAFVLPKKSNIMNLKTLLPHQIALKDNVHTVLFSHFQKTTATHIADGNTVNLHKSTAYKQTLKFLTFCYRLQDVYNRLHVKKTAAQHPEQVDDSMRLAEGGSPAAQLFNPIEEKFLQTEMTAVAFMPGPISSALTVSRVKESEVRCYLKLRSILEPLKLIASAFKYHKHGAITNKRLLEIQNILKLLLCYLYDMDLDKSTDYTQIEQEPVRERQVAFKELGFIDLLMELIHFPFANNFYQIEHVHKPLYISRVISLSYTAIRVGIREVRSNELYASQWLDMMIEYAIKDSKNILKAKETLTELIDNNERILSSHVKEATIRKFIANLLNSGFDSRNVSIIRALCVCNGKPMTKNQEIVTQVLLSDRIKLGVLTSELKMNEFGTVVMVNPWSLNSTKMVELKLLKEKSEVFDRRAYFDFYVNLIGMLSDICFGRNYLAINFLKEWFPLEVVFEIIVNPVYPAELRTVFVSLLDKLYLDVFPFQPLRIPYLVREFQSNRTDRLATPARELEGPNNQNSSQMPTDTPGEDSVHLANRTKYSRLIDFLLEYLKTGTISFDDVDEDSIRFVDAVLKLLCQLISFGFFRQDAEFRKIYIGIMRIMSPLWHGQLTEKVEPQNLIDESSTSRASGRAFQRRSTAAINAKIKSSSTQINSFTDLRKSICQVVKILLQVELDFQISKGLHVFKHEFYQKFENLNIRSDSLGVDSILVGDSPGQKSIVSEHLKQMFESVNQKVARDEPIIISHRDQLVSMLIDNTLVEDNELKKLSLALLKDIYSSTENIISAMQSVLLVENESESELKSTAEKLHLVLFKLHEKMPTWYGKSQSSEHNQLRACLLKISKGLEEYQALRTNGSGMNFVDEAPSLGPELQKICSRYLFVRTSVFGSFQYSSTFYSEIIQATGILNELAKILDHMISHIHQVPKECLEQNKFLLDMLVLEMSKLVSDAQPNKLILQPRIQNWILSSTCYGENGDHIAPESVKHMFSAHRFTEELQQNSQMIQLGLSPTSRNKIQTPVKLLASPSKSEFERSKLKLQHDVEASPPVDSSRAPGNPSHFMSPSRYNPSDNADPEYPEEGANPYFGGLSVLVLNYLRGNRLISSNKHEVEAIGRQILDFISQDEARPPNYYMCAYFILALEQLVFFKGHVVKSTQNFLLRQIVERNKQGALARYQSMILEATLAQDLACPEIISKFNDSTVIALNPKLCLSAAFLSLLSACSYERNEYGEKIAQSLVPPEILSSILSIGSQTPLITIEKPGLEGYSPIKGSAKDGKNFSLANGRNKQLGAASTPRRSLFFEYEIVKFMLYSYFETEISYDSKQMEINIELMRDARGATVYYLTHCELIPHSKLFLNYTKMVFELFKEFFSTVLAHSGRDLSALKAESESVSQLINLMAVECNFCIRESKSTELTHILKTFLDQLAGHMLNTDLFQVNEEAALILKSAHPIAKGAIQMRQLAKVTADFIPPKEQSDIPSPMPTVPNETVVVVRQDPNGPESPKKPTTPSKPSSGGNSGQNMSLQGLSKSNRLTNQKPQVKISVSDVVRKGFEAISLEDYYTSEVDKEFEKLIYKGDDQEIASSFNGFLVGLMNYVRAEMSTVTDEVLCIFFIIIKSYLITSQEEELQGKTLKSKQGFMLKNGLVELICRCILERDSPEVIFQGLESVNTLMAECNIHVQSAFIHHIKLQGSYQFFTKLISIVDNYLEVIERDMMRINSSALLNFLIELSSEEENKTDEYVRMLEKVKKVQLFFEFLGSLCEGHNLQVQEFLRDQSLDTKVSKGSTNIAVVAIQEGIFGIIGPNEDAQLTLNIIKYAAEVFQSVVKYLNKDSISLGTSILEFLIEAVQGPSEGNQRTLLEQEIFIACKDTLSDLHRKNYASLKTRGFHLANQESNHMISLMVKNVVALLMALLEGNDSEELIVEIGSMIDFELLMDPLAHEYRNYFAINFGLSPKALRETPVDQLISKINSSTFTGQICDCLEIFLFIRTINENSDKYKQAVKNLKGIHRAAYNFFMENTAHIEINFQGKITKTYFVKHPACRYLSEEVQMDLMNNVNRESPNQKVADFVNSSQSLFNRMEYLQKLITRYKINPLYVVQFRKLSLFICALVNLYLFVFSQFKVVKNTDHDDLSQYSDNLVTIFAWVYCFTNSISLFFFLVETVYLRVINSWSDWIFELKYLKDITPVEQIWLNYMIEKDSFELRTEDYLELIRFKRAKEGNSTTAARLVKLAYDIKFMGGEFWLQLFFTICFLMGIITGDKWFYCFPLLDMMNMSGTLMALIQSVTLNGDQILLAVALVVVIIFLYSLYAYYYVLDTFWNSSFGSEGENQCTSVRHCFFTIFSLGPRSSGSVGDMLLRMSYATNNLTKWYSRYIFDLSVFVIVNVLGMNIIFGIIIQTFAAIREKLNFQTQDKENVCFACSLDKNEIEKTLRGFEFHITEDHNIWNYLYFIYYLKRKPAGSITGPHSDVREKITKDDIFWFPFGKCLALKHQVAESKDIKSQVEEISRGLQKTLDEMEKPEEKEIPSQTQADSRIQTEQGPSVTNREHQPTRVEGSDILMLKFPAESDRNMDQQDLFEN